MKREDGFSIPKQSVVGLPLNVFGSNAATGTAISPANTAILMPFWVPFECTVQNCFATILATLTGNYDIGIYDKNGNRVASLGSTPAPGGTGVTKNALSAALKPSLNPYFYAIASDNTSLSFLKHVDSPTSNLFRPLHYSSSFPLPASLNLGSPTGRTLNCYRIFFEVTLTQGFGY